MRKVLSLVVAFMLVSSLSYAQSTRNPANNDPAKSVFGNVATTGLDVAGNASYIELVSTDANGSNPIRYYVWVDSSGDLKIASRVTMETLASFPSGDWRRSNEGGGFNIGTVVGSQS